MNNEHKDAISKLVEGALLEALDTPSTAEGRTKSLDLHNLLSRYGAAVFDPEISPVHFNLNVQTMALLWHHFLQINAALLSASERAAKLETRVERLESDNRELREQVSSLRSFVISLSHIVEDSERKRIARLRDSLGDPP